MRKKGNSLLCEALSVPAASSVSDQCNQALKACRTRSLRFISRFWCVSSLSGYMCVTRVCVHTRVPGGSIVHQHCHVLTNKLHRGIEPKVRFLFYFLLVVVISPASQSPCRMRHLLSPLCSAPSPSCCPPQYRFWCS